MSKDNKLKLDYIAEILNSLDYGSIHISIHDGKITEIDTANTKNQYPVLERE